MVNLRDVFIFNIKFDLCAFDHNLLDAQNSLKSAFVFGEKIVRNVHQCFLKTKKNMSCKWVNLPILQAQMLTDLHFAQS